MRLPQLFISFLLSTIMAAAVLAEPILGLQSWTCRKMNFEEVVEFAVEHHISHVEFIAAHLDPAASPAESLRKKAYLAEHGVTAYSIGVCGTTLDKEENRKLFEFAKLMDIKVIVVEPRDPAIWDNLEELVREYDIKLAVHNHGTGTVFGNPATVKDVLATRDPRIGVCLDVGWVTAAGYDAAEVFRDYGDRVFDMHFKDKTLAENAEGKIVPTDTLIGEGKANYQGLFAEIIRTDWSGVMAIETDSDAFATNPGPLVESAAEYFSAQLSAAR